MVPNLFWLFYRHFCCTCAGVRIAANRMMLAVILCHETLIGVGRGLEIWAGTGDMGGDWRYGWVYPTVILMY
jgi:hypothetical protein